MTVRPSKGRQKPKDVLGQTKVRTASIPRTGKPIKVPTGKRLASSARAGAAAAEFVSPIADAMAQMTRGSENPLRAVFFSRALRGLVRLASELPVEALQTAAGAPSDYAVLISALERPEALAAPRQDDPLAAARLRGAAMRQRILEAEDGAFTAEQVGKHLGMTRQAVDKRRKAGRLLALSTGRRGYLYPKWQFSRSGVLDGFEHVLADLSVRDPWMQAAFFLSGDPRLDGRTPLEVLRAGNVEPVLRAARGYGKHSAA